MIGDIIRCKRCGLCREVIEDPTGALCLCGKHVDRRFPVVKNQLADKTIERCPNCATAAELADDIAAHTYRAEAIAAGTGNN